MSEDFTRWPLRTRGSVAFLQKNRKSVEKSCLDHFYSSRNMRNRFNILELLFVVPKNTLELHFSSEIDKIQFEEVDFPEFPLKS